MCGKRNMFKIKPNFALRIFLDTGHKLIRRSEDILNKPLMYVQLTSCIQGGTLPSRNTLGEKCPYKEFFFSPNAGKYGPEKIPYLYTFHAVIIAHTHK